MGKCVCVLSENMKFFSVEVWCSVLGGKSHFDSDKKKNKGNFKSSSTFLMEFLRQFKMDGLFGSWLVLKASS